MVFIIKKMEKVFIHYLERDKKTGKDKDIDGFFEFVKEGRNFLIVRTSKNEIKIPYHRIIKMKGGKDKI